MDLSKLTSIGFSGDIAGVKFGQVKELVEAAERNASLWERSIGVVY